MIQLQVPSIIEDLKQVDAIEIIEERIPEGQKEESLKRLSEMKASPSLPLSEEGFFKGLDDENGWKGINYYSLKKLCFVVFI